MSHQLPTAEGTPAPCRLIVDAPAGGAWNMAVDAALLEAAARGQWSLRFYSWEEPTLSLGYFQPYEQRLTHAESQRCPVVRRSSGGGAIVHDREITYSLAVPGASPAARRAVWLYQVVHEALLASLAACGIRAERQGELAKTPATDEPFLCFERRAAGDVLCGGVKICGSAQRRQGTAVLEHGSLLLERSPAAPQLPGLWDVADVRVPSQQIVDSWSAELSGRLGLDLAPAGLGGLELASAERFAERRYGVTAWTRRR